MTAFIFLCINPSLLSFNFVSSLFILAQKFKSLPSYYVTINKLFNTPHQVDEAQARIKIAGRNINNLRYADDTTLMAESEQELRSLLKVKEESEKLA